MGHINIFQISGRGCQILPWSWEIRSCLIGISQGCRYRRGISAENHIWDGQNGATSRRRTPLSFTLHRAAGISLTCGNTYSLTFGQGWTNASMPRGAGEFRENQSEHWDDSCDAKSSTSTTPNKSQIWAIVCRFSIHSPGRKWAARFKTPGMWTALRERNLSWDQRKRRRASLFRMRDREPPWRFMWDTTTMLSVLTFTWHLLRRGRKWISARKTALSFRQFMCQERNSPVQKPCAGLPLKTAPQPVIDTSVVKMWQRWIAPILIPLRRKMGSRHIKRVWKQLRGSLIRRVAGPVERILKSLIHQRNGRMWSNPRGSTGEAAAKRPRSLWQVLTETWWPSLKRAIHALKLKIRAGARLACIWTESKWTPKNTVCREGVRTLFLVFVLRPRARMW